MAGSIAIISQVVGVISTVSGFLGKKKQAKFADTGAKARQEAADIQTAQQQNQERSDRRKRFREERVRRAQILQSASNAGVSVSSGAVGAVSALGTNTGAAISGSLARSSAREGIAGQNRIAGAAAQSAAQAGATAGLFAAGVGVFETGIDIFKSGIFDTSTNTSGTTGSRGIPVFT